MTAKPILPRKRAEKDVEEAINYYLQEAIKQIALEFVESVEKAYERISTYPGSGSSLYAHELNLPGLRSWQIKKFPFLIFYMENEDHIDIWRILHGERDISTWMQESEINLTK